MPLFELNDSRISPLSSDIFNPAVNKLTFEDSLKISYYGGNNAAFISIDWDITSNLSAH